MRVEIFRGVIDKEDLWNRVLWTSLGCTESGSPLVQTPIYVPVSSLFGPPTADPVIVSLSLPELPV